MDSSVVLICSQSCAKITIICFTLSLALQREMLSHPQSFRTTPLPVPNVWLPPLECPLLGTWPPTQAGALTGNRTGDPLVRRLALSVLSHISHGATCESFSCENTWSSLLLLYVGEESQRQYAHSQCCANITVVPGILLPFSTDPQSPVSGTTPLPPPPTPGGHRCALPPSL